MKNREKQWKKKVDISELGTATRSRGRRATEPGLRPNNRFACSMLTTAVRNLGSNRLNPEFGDDEMCFFPVKFFSKNYSFEAFLVPTKGNPQNDWFKSISKKCNKPRSGKKGSSLGAQIVVP